MSTDNAASSAAGGPAPRWAVIGLFLIAAFGAATFARTFLMPLSLGILLFFVFSPLCRFLIRLHLPRPLAAAIITIGLLVGITVAAGSLAVPFTNTIENAPTIINRLQYKMENLRGSVEKVQQAAKQINQIGEGDSGTGEDGDTSAAPAADSNYLSRMAMTAPAVVGQIVFCLVLLYFLLASGDLLYRRIVQSFSHISDKRSALAAMHAIEHSLGSYLGAITIINACLGIAIGCAMWFWNMPNPALFGMAGWALNYIPYLGAIAGVFVATIVALVSLPGFVTPLLVGASYFLLTSIEGQLVTPYFVSRRLQLNTPVVFVAVALFAWLWSAVGMVVAVPMLVVLHVLCSYIPGMRSLGNLLAGETPPHPEEQASATEGSAEQEPAQPSAV